MGFIKDNIIRRQFQELLEQGELIYSEAAECLKPCYNVYYHYFYDNLGMTREILDVTTLDIQISLSTLSSYIPQLIRLRSSIVGTFKQNYSLLKKYDARFLEISNSLEKLYSVVNSLLRDSKALNGSKSYAELKTMVAYLENIHKQLSMCNSSAPVKDNTSVTVEVGHSIV